MNTLIEVMIEHDESVQFGDTRDFETYLREEYTDVYDADLNWIGYEADKQYNLGE